MKNIFALAITFLSLHAANAQTPFDSFDSTMANTPIHKAQNTKKFIIPINDNFVSYLKLDIEEKTIGYYSQKDSLITSVILSDNKIKWLSIDPLAKNYPGMSPYNFVGNMPISAIDPDGQEIYVLFSTINNKDGDDLFTSSVQTRQRNIENSKTFDPTKDKVLVIQITDMAQIKNQMESIVKNYSKQFGNTKEVGVWSHSGWDGPVGTEQASSDPLFEQGSNQMSLTGWSKINFNWSTNNPNCTFYGCNSGNDYLDNTFVGSFSRKISDLNNFNNVQVSGQTSSTFPSLSPYVRETTLLRSFSPSVGFSGGNTYMVGGADKQGFESLWFMQNNPPANELNVYQNGQLVDKGLQTTSATNPIIR